MKRLFVICLTALSAFCLSAQPAGNVTFRGVLALLQQCVEKCDIAPKATADAAGLQLVFYHCYDEGEFYSFSIYYARNANVLAEYDENYDRKLEKTADHACVMGIEAATSSGGNIYFSDEGDYDRFLSEALDYGLMQEQGGNTDVYFINDKPLENGGLHIVPNEILWAAMLGESAATCRPQFMLRPQGKNAQGWYTYSIGIDF